MWIVAVNIGHYPYVREFSDRSEAQVYYDKESQFLRRINEIGKVWIARVENADSIQ